MKKLSLLGIILLSVLVSCNKPVKGKNGVTYKSAVSYNDYIVSRQNTLIQNVIAFGQTARTDLDSAERLLQGFVKQTGGMVDELKGMPAYKGDSSLRDAAVNTFSFYKRVFENEYMTVLNLKKKPDFSLVVDQPQIDSIIQKVTTEERGFDSRFHEAQMKFASSNNMRLTDNKMQKELEKMKQGN